MCFGAVYWAHLDRLVYAGTAADAKAAGFDDAFIYEELRRPLAQRRLKTFHAPSADMDAVFAAWRAKADKIAY